MVESPAGPPVTVIAASAQAQGWTFLEQLDSVYPGVNLYVPPRTAWSSYLRADNLHNILSQIAVIALVAVGMTLVIATGGIDLSLAV